MPDKAFVKMALLYAKPVGPPPPPPPYNALYDVQKQKARDNAEDCGIRQQMLHGELKTQQKSFYRGKWPKPSCPGQTPTMPPKIRRLEDPFYRARQLTDNNNLLEQTRSERKIAAPEQHA